MTNSSCLRTNLLQDLLDQFGLMPSGMMLCIGLLIATLWVVNSPSFEKCSAFENVMERNNCYDLLRAGSLKPPGKGADLRY
jgi:hypothetical protein